MHAFIPRLLAVAVPPVQARQPAQALADLGVPFVPLIRIDVPTYEADALPPELAAIPPMKPGSRAAA